MTWVWIGLGMIALFAAGFGLSRMISSKTSAAAEPTPLPCITITPTANAALPAPAKVKTNVYNSTATKGLARKTAAQLKAQGFVIATVANDPNGQIAKGVGEIRHGTAGLAGAQLLALYLPGAKLVDDGRDGATVDVAVGPEFGAVLTKAQVDAEKASPEPTTTGAGCPGATPQGATGASAAVTASP